MANAKIVVTLGPASDAHDTVCTLIRAGATIFRLNTSHGSWEQHQKRIETVRAAEKQTGIPVGILLDLQGPKIRLGKFAAGHCTLATGSRFIITTEETLGDETRASTIYRRFANDVHVGDRVLLNDGAVTLRAIATDGISVTFDVVSGGPVGDNKGINLPGIKVSAPSMTPKDLSDLRAGIEAGVDFVAISFVRSAADVQMVRERMGAARVPIIAKIEKPEAVQDIDAILDVADGIMVARGDLGVEMSLEMVPPIQKRLIRKARRRNRFVITATQMLESMIENPNPTRAEVSDVANAVYDGSDAVMLSAETSVGKHPVGGGRIYGEDRRGGRTGITASRIRRASGDRNRRFGDCGRRRVSCGEVRRRRSDCRLHRQWLQRPSDFAVPSSFPRDRNDQFARCREAIDGELRRHSRAGAGCNYHRRNARPDGHIPGSARVLISG